MELEGYTVVRYRTAIEWLFTAVSAIHFLHSSEVRSATGISHKTRDACDVGRNTEEVNWAGINEFASKGLDILLQKWNIQVGSERGGRAGFVGALERNPMGRLFSLGHGLLDGKSGTCTLKSPEVRDWAFSVTECSRVWSERGRSQKLKFRTRGRQAREVKVGDIISDPQC